MTVMAAFRRWDGRPVAEEIQRMTSAQAVYGPEGSHVWHQDGTGLSCCRLAFTPEDRLDRQPLTSRASGLSLVADIRLDNREEIARALDISPAELKHLSDTDILLSALEAWGEAAPSRLIGNYAFACWDPHKQQLLCARDALGESPLHYSQGDGWVAVASMPLGLLALPEVPSDLDEMALVRWILLLPTTEQHFYSSIRKLKPGHLMVASQSGIRIRRYWEFPERNALKFSSEAETIEAFTAVLDDAVRCRLRAIGPVGCHLSAGMDSGSVTATTARLLAKDGERLTAFTAVPRAGYTAPGLNGRPSDEGPGAAALAAMYPNIDHVLIRSDPATTPLHDLETMGLITGQPTPSFSNSIWINAIARSAQERQIRTILTGKMGNLTISYSGKERFPAMLASGQLFTWLGEMIAWTRQRGKRPPLRASISPFVPPWFWYWYERLRGTDNNPLFYTALSPDFARTLDLEALAEDAGWDMSYRHGADGHAMRIAVLNRVDNAFNRPVRQAAFGVDHRDPTKDRRVVAFCLALPDTAFLKDGIEKRLLRHGMRGRMPEETLFGYKPKGYQSADFHEHMTVAHASLVQQLERIEQSPTASRLLDVPRMKNLLTQWPTDGWHKQSTTSQYRKAFLRGLAAGIFMCQAESSK